MDWLFDLEVFVLIVTVVATFFLYWKNGGRDAFLEPRSERMERWETMFQGGEAADGASRAEKADIKALNALGQRCDLALKTLMQDDTLVLSYRDLDYSVGGSLAALLTANRALMVLDLSSNALDGQAVESMLFGASASGILQLDLSRNSLQGLGAGAALGKLVCSLKSLRTLHAAQNHLGDEGGREFVKELSNANSALEKLTLNRNSLGDETAFAMGAFLLRNTSLKQVSLWGNANYSRVATTQLRMAWGKRAGALVLDEDL